MNDWLYSLDKFANEIICIIILAAKMDGFAYAHIGILSR